MIEYCLPSRTLRSKIMCSTMVVSCRTATLRTNVLRKIVFNDTDTCSFMIEFRLLNEHFQVAYYSTTVVIPNKWSVVTIGWNIVCYTHAAKLDVWSAMSITANEHFQVDVMIQLVIVVLSDEWNIVCHTNPSKLGFSGPLWSVTAKTTW